MKLRTTLMASPAVGSLILAVCLLGFLSVVHTFQTKTRGTYEASEFSQQQLGSATTKLSEANVLLYRTVAIIASLSEDEVKTRRANLAKLDKALTETLSDVVTDSDAAQTKAFSDAVKKYQGSADSAIDLASMDPNTGVAALQTAEEAHAKAVAALSKLGDAVNARSKAEIDDLEAGVLRQQIMIAVLGLLAGAGSFAFAWVMQGRVIRDIKDAANAADDVAQGRFDRLVQVARDDELGQLQAALARMVKELGNSITVVQHAALSIGQASIEIAAGNQDLSHRTENTASSLQETASSMDQLTGTVRHTVESAHSANSLVHSASDAAKRGGEVMGQVVSNMAEIDAASRKINEIIGVIDGIAFQTNILALNAAVEAARAGEQGRGFAVVAGEVRSLAQRSANAAREIKTLISSSTERVEAGARLVQEAGASMQDIVVGVERVTQIIGEITQAAEQESEGIGQVNSAVTHLDQMTQQNAALVEQSAAAAESLRSQAQTLSNVVGRFKLA
jgi:methyl-accepting chemotaxis protein